MTDRSASQSACNAAGLPRGRMCCERGPRRRNRGVGFPLLPTPRLSQPDHWATPCRECRPFGGPTCIRETS